MLREYEYISFFTATILSWKKLLVRDEYKEIVVNSLRYLTENRKVHVYAFVIMPNHLHMLWKILPPYTLVAIQRDFLKFTSQSIKFRLAEHHPQVLNAFYVNLKDRKYQFWQRNAKSILLPSRKILEQKLDYIHNNPCQKKWMLADNPFEYPYSSIRFYEGLENRFDFLRHYMEEY